MNQNKSKKDKKRAFLLGQNQDNYQMLLLHAKSLYRMAIQKFPNCSSLRLSYAFFLIERMNKKTEALAELNVAA